MINKGNKKITVLLCTLNEEKNLPYVLPRLPKGIDEILIVDGGSTDNTVEVAKKLCPSARVVFQPGKGKGDALRYGIRRARGDIIVMFDADGSMAPEEIPRFVKPLLEGYDFVKGSRFLPGGGTSDMTRHRIFGNWVFTTLTNIFHRTKYTDL
ncbi:MAG: glycosyltransferase family 2 protein, partial [Desulfotomaculaceae bacterium]|nr:glycosyltransferase family 2 protein [Desulfotomaculaceae bacterium]